ncbi:MULTISPECIES: aminopeptidase P N-terminal domain-containing protein [unclassified Janthinobacterium]|uniref:aminopeptidase P N-terminal domain-containing protein n=1 Tax=unclassified Janthinobacterium TaxID=2610881 RepID=UPI001622CE63|nr:MULTISPECIES: aminopeptidase P N-terminal domain-containing protein [unclassified Janthinobacterium]
MANYAARRAALMAQMLPGSVAIIATAPEVARNSDCDYPYRHDSYFYYLSGYTEPHSALALVAASATAPARAILFCRAKNTEREIWDGFRHGPEAARLTFGFDAAFPIEELDVEMAHLLADAPALYYALGGSLDTQVKLWLQQVRQKARSGITAPNSAHDISGMLDAMRLFKDAEEQVLMRRAADISSAAHARAMRATRPGLHEYAIEAELLYEFRRNGAQFPAYSSIVAGGANACILHYSANNAVLNDGDLLLIDAGCELDGYASDITRTYPVNGRFSGPQKALYELVLAAQQAAFDVIRPGSAQSAIHEAAVQVLAQGMLDLHLLDRQQHGSVQDVIADKSYLPFYMHGTSHWLGMDVHDVGAYRDTGAAGKPWRALAPGMVLTVEPGIYVRPGPGVPERFWHTGIRIEDDVLVTPQGHEIFSTAPKSVAEIEQLMSHTKP